MGALDSGGEVKQKKGKGLRRPARRAGIRMDMTPMVDIAFLLLIFFMVTTVFRAPQAMEMNLPPSDAKVEVPESNVMTIFVRADERVYYRVAKDPLAPIPQKDLRQLFKDQSRLNPELIIIVKLHPKARYELMVALFDELELADMSRFSLIEMPEAEIEEVEALP
jgi:biopolymer transport protein ExbD